MNDWMCKDLEWDPAYRPDRGKVLSAEQLEQIQVFHRYVDADGDGIPYRTLPGAHPKGAYFVRGSGHNQFGMYTEDPVEYRQVVDRLTKKWRTAADLVPAPVVRRAAKAAKWGLIGIGSSDGAIREALDRLATSGMHLDYCRLRAYPFSDEVARFVEQHERVFVVEQNRDAQLKSLLTIELGCDPSRLHSILEYSGLPIDCRCIVETLERAAARGAAA
jgi:2-oxoglutarate ferredoxin oxidoreductase subunit alpha